MPTNIKHLTQDEISTITHKSRGFYAFFFIIICVFPFLIFNDVNWFASFVPISLPLSLSIAICLALAAIAAAYFKYWNKHTWDVIADVRTHIHPSSNGMQSVVHLSIVNCDTNVFLFVFVVILCSKCYYNWWWTQFLRCVLSFSANTILSAHQFRRSTDYFVENKIRNEET